MTRPDSRIHSTPRRMALLTSAALAALAASPTAALAQDAVANWPTKTITLIVPYAPGGSSDTRARQIAQKIGSYLGKTVVVDNKAGAGGNIGTDAIAKAQPDGYTIGLGNFAPLSVNKTMMAKVPFDPTTDLIPVVLIEKGPIVVVVSADKSPYKSFKDMIAFAKANPGKLSYGSAGTGGAYHLAGELIKDATGTFTVHIPYRGGGPATTDLIAGQVDYMFDMLPSAMTYIKSTPPRMRVLAVATEKRLPQIPDVPTFAELGLKGMEMSNWFGIVAPKGTPPAIVAKLNAAVNRALKEPDMIERIAGQGNIVGGGTPEEFAAFVSSETKRWSKLVKEKHITAE